MDAIAAAFAALILAITTGLPVVITIILFILFILFILLAGQASVWILSWLSVMTGRRLGVNRRRAGWTL